ncbi:MAG: DUF1648 domain-containing protein [Aquiluna sp.]
MKTSAKLLLSAVPAVVFLGFSLWALTLNQDERLPDPLATHWSAAGTADGFASFETHLTWALVAMGSPGLIWLVLIWAPGLRGTVQRVFLAVAGLLFVIMTMIQVFAIAIQIDKVAAADARLELPFLLLLVPVLLMLGVFLARPRVVVAQRLEVSLRGLRMFSCEYSEIASVDTATLRGRDFGGFGLRFSRGKVAFMPSPGLALQIQTTDGQTILVRSDEAEDLVQRIKQQMGR